MKVKKKKKVTGIDGVLLWAHPAVIRAGAGTGRRPPPAFGRPRGGELSAHPLGAPYQGFPIVPAPKNMLRDL